MSRHVGPPCSRRHWKCSNAPAWLEPFLRAGVRIRHVQLLGPGLREIAARKDSRRAAAVYEFQCSLPQWRTEAILRDHLSSLGLEIEFGTEVTSIDAEGRAPCALCSKAAVEGRRSRRSTRWVQAVAIVSRVIRCMSTPTGPTTADISLPM